MDEIAKISKAIRDKTFSAKYRVLSKQIERLPPLSSIETSPFDKEGFRTLITKYHDISSEFGQLSTYGYNRQLFELYLKFCEKMVVESNSGNTNEDYDRTRERYPETTSEDDQQREHDEEERRKRDEEERHKREEERLRRKRERERSRSWDRGR